VGTVHGIFQCLIVIGVLLMPGCSNVEKRTIDSPVALPEFFPPLESEIPPLNGEFPSTIPA